MKTGIEAFERSVARKSGGTSSGYTGRYLGYFILAEGESKIIRFLTDVDELLIDIDFYEFVLTPSGKYQNFVVAPSFHAENPSWNGEDWVLKYGGKVKPFGSHVLENPTPRARTIGLAVEREEVPVDDAGKRALRTQDKLVQFEGKDGNTYDARNFFVVKPTSRNFWPSLVDYYHEFGTLCDRDYKITRTGTGRDIHYSIIPKSPDPNWNNDGTSLAELQARYGYKTGKDMDGNELADDSPDRYLYWTQSLRDWAENQASEERAKAALAPEDSSSAESRPAPGWASSSADEPQAAAPVPAAPAPAASGTDVSSLRARLERHR